MLPHTVFFLVLLLIGRRERGTILTFILLQLRVGCMMFSGRMASQWESLLQWLETFLFKITRCCLLPRMVVQTFSQQWRDRGRMISVSFNPIATFSTVFYTFFIQGMYFSPSNKGKTFEMRFSYFWLYTELTVSINTKPARAHQISRTSMLKRMEVGVREWAISDASS